MDYPVLEHLNQTGHGGQNQRLNGRLLSDMEFERLLNADVSTPGLRKKRFGTAAAVCLLTAPTLLAVGGATVTTLTITWTPSSNPGDVTVIERSTNNVTFTKLVEVTFPTATYVDTGLMAGVTYYYRAAAQSGCTTGFTSAVSGTVACPAITMTAIDTTAVVGDAYSESTAASGGTGPYAYVKTSGTLPTGTTLNASTGALAGTLTLGAVFAFTITATDANGCVGSRDYTVTVTDPVPSSCPGGSPATITIAFTHSYFGSFSIAAAGSGCSWDGSYIIPSGPEAGVTVTVHGHLENGVRWYSNVGISSNFAQYEKTFGLTPSGAYSEIYQTGGFSNYSVS